ncbi:MAG: hypothetical protein IPO72_01930 [Saprospiraceae bacterium]|nr:hypothetical protein [Candidatus Vicinibacter affinis]MBK6821560.1 hypothetical protein [Candidatus Vicinibacter affinis]MBK7800008.1 hypothetical protein [Candidatus Vicinibacter affinis]MBK9640068.1 hypothetical protein [Candidatus Vicinibacter affinis]
MNKKCAFTAQAQLLGKMDLKMVSNSINVIRAERTSWEVTVWKVCDCGMNMLRVNRLMPS